MSPDHATSVEIKLEVRDLHVWYDKQHAVRGITLDIADRKTVALIGATGSGRSAVLRALNRLHDLDPAARVEGSVKIDGAEVLGQSTDVPALRAAGSRSCSRLSCRSRCTRTSSSGCARKASA